MGLGISSLAVAAAAAAATLLPIAETSSAAPASPSTASNAQASCVIERGVDYPGGDLFRQRDVTSAERCAELCARYPGCRSFTYGRKQGAPYYRSCFLKAHARRNPVASDCCDSGLPCAADAPLPGRRGGFGRRAASGKLGIFVVTAAGEQYEERVRAARRSWAPNFLSKPVGDAQHGVLFVSSIPSSALGVEAVDCSDDARAGYCCKVVEGFRMALGRFPDAEWLVMASDDSFVFPHQLERELQVFNASQRVFVGAPSISVSCLASGHEYSCAEVHAAGGAGFILSRSLALDLAKHSEVFLRGCVRDDMHLGHFLRYAFDVHLHSLPGLTQEPRFKGLSWTPPAAEEEVQDDADAGLPPACPSPLPPSVYARMGDFGPLRSLAPLEASRLAVVHSDPSIWPALDALPTIVERLPPDQALLAYLDAGHMRRLVGPHYEQLRELGLCVYNRSERLESFGVAPPEPPALDRFRQSRPTIRWAEEIGHGDVLQRICGQDCEVAHASELLGHGPEDPVELLLTVRITKRS